MPISTAPDAYGWLLGEGPRAIDRRPTIATVGGKGAQTARLLEAGLPVPPTGVVTVDAYRAAAADPGVAALLARIDGGATVSAEVVDAAFTAAVVPDAVVADILRLGAVVAGAGRLAVRSSATVEDLAGTSFAGQYRSFLDVEPGPELLHAIRLVWASLWHPAPCAYRRVHGIDDAGAAMAVVLMAMVPAVQAGVVFSVDPGGPGDHVRVEAVDGLGEALVSGAVTPRSWSLPRAGAAAAPVPIGEVVDLALAAEQHFGVPLDVEWAWDGARAWLVQARPITTTDAVADDLDTPADDHVLTTAGIAEMLPGVLPPLVWQLAGTAVEEAIRVSFEALGALDPGLVAPHALVRRVRGRAALDLDALTAVASRLPGGSAEAVEHGFFGTGDAPPPAPRAAWLPSLRHDLRVEQARRRALHEARVTAAAAEHLASDGPLLADLSDVALLGLRRRTVDLGQRAMAAEIGVSAAATAAYERLDSFVCAHLPRAEATRWVQRITVGISGPPAPSRASMSVFAGPTWDEAGLRPPAPPRPDGRAAEKLAELEDLLRALPRWRLTRIVTGQVVDVRLHLLRRLAGEARLLLGWRERAKVAVLTLGGLVREVHLALAERMVARGELEHAGDVDLLTDAELCGDTALPGLALMSRRRRTLARMAAAGSLPERFSGRPDVVPRPMPAGDRLTGIAASAGRHTGRARVVRDPLDATLHAGEILVAETTDAGWSPLFAQAGAIVVERGGQLSHAAIVARELGVPAVLDVDGATGVLDGRTVTVDGDLGVVVIHDEGPR